MPMELHFIAHEDLKIRNMSRSPVPKPAPDRPGTFLPNGAAAKAGLNKSINDAGREVIAVDPRNTSRACPQCGHRLPRTDRAAPPAARGKGRPVRVPGQRHRLRRAARLS
nr:zinc ribbon domain-containing protein [Streptomyces sp. AC512_CC834]